MSSQSGISFGGVVICVSSGSQDHIGWNSTLQTLLSKSKSLEFFQAIFFCSTIHNCVPENNVSNSRVENCRLTRPAATSFIDILGVLERPRVSTLAMQQAGEIITLVQKLENAG